MMPSLSHSTNIRLLLPETLWLDTEDFDRARSLSQQSGTEQEQWQTYLNALARSAFHSWVQAQLPQAAVQPKDSSILSVAYLQVDEYDLCLIATDHVLDEVVQIPSQALEPEFAAHFYVVLEVLEEAAQVIIRGFLRHDELMTGDRQPSGATQSNERYLLPLSALDTEINHLVFYTRYASATAILLPTVSSQLAAPMASPQVSRATSGEQRVEPTANPQLGEGLKTRLSQWLQDMWTEGWQTIDTLINPEANLALSTRQLPVGAKGGKLINFGVQLGNQTVALLITVTPDVEEKVSIGVQVLPVAGEPYLPPHLKLVLLSKADTVLQESQSREQDNYIQLRSFRGKPGASFSIEVRLNDVKIREEFEL